MTTFYKTCLIYFALLLIPFQFSAANYYWIGGAGNWSDINHWATTSGGSTLHSFVPNQNDNVFFDAGSGFTAASKIVAVNTNATCLNMIWSGALNAPTLTGSASFILNIYGSVTLQPNMIYSVYNTEFKSNAAGQTITSSSATYASGGLFTFSGTGSWTFQDAFIASGYNVTFNSGALNTNNQVLSIGNFSSGTALNRVLSLGSSTITTNGASGWYYTGTNATLNAGTSTIILNYNVTSTVWNSFTTFASSAYYNVIFNKAGNMSAVNSTFNSVLFLDNGDLRSNTTINTLTFSTGKIYTLYGASTTSVTGQFNANPGTCSGWITITNNNPGSTQANLRMPATASVNVSNCNIQNINVAGGATFNANNSTDEGNNTGWIFTAPTLNSLYWIGGNGNWNDGNHWATTSGGASSGCIPGPATDVFFDAGSGLSTGMETITINGTSNCHNFTSAGSPIPPKLICPVAIMGSLGIFGSVILQSGMTYSVATIFKSSSAETIQSNGVTFNSPEGSSITMPTGIMVNGTGSWSFSDAFNTSAVITHIRGTINTNNMAVSLHALQYSGVVSFIKILNLGSSVINVNSNSNSAWNYSIGTLNAGTSHIIFNTVGAGIFPGNNYTYYDVTFMNKGQISGGVNRTFNNVLFMKDGTILGANLFNNLTFSPNSVYTLDAASNQTITGQFNASPVACGGWIRIESITAGTQATVNMPATAIVNVSSTLIKDTRVLGGATFNATNSIDNGNNTGWAFGAVTTNNLYWVGGNGDWNDANHWSRVNNGIYPATVPCVPGPGDDVFFNANSGLTATAKTVTITSSVYCHNITCAGSAIPPTIMGTYSGITSTGFLNVYGSMVLQNGGIYKTELIFRSPNAEMITTNGATFASSGATFAYVAFDGAGSWTLQDDVNSLVTVILNQGTLNTNNKNMSMPIFNDYHYAGIYPANTTGVRQLNLGASTVTITSGTVAWYYDQVNSSLNAGTSHIIFNTTATMRTKNGHNYNDVTFKNANSTSYINGTGSNFNNVVCLQNMDIYGAHQFNTLTFAGGKVYRLQSGITQSVTTAFYPSGNPCFITFLQSMTPGTRANINVQAGNPDYDFVNAKDIDATPSYTTLTIAGHGTDAGNNANITFAPTTTVTLSGLGSDITHCQSALPITLTTTAFFPNPLTTYTWTGSGSGNANNLVVNTGGTYSVSVNYGQSCVVTDAIVVTANPNPTLTVTGITTICSGAASTLSVTGASTYTWTTPSATTNTITVSPSGTTSYSVVGTNTIGCISNEQVVTVTVNTTPTVGITSVSNSSICSGNSSLITPGGASTYTLMPGNMVGTSFNVSPSTTTTYTINGTGTTGCINTAGSAPTTIITVNTTPTVGIASVSNATICSGNNTIITPNGASTYTLMPGNMVGTSFNLSPSATTTYTINGTGATGCINTAGSAPTTIITVNTTPTVGIASVSNATICSGNNTVITPNGASTYTLMPGNMVGPSFNVSPSVTTTYTINGTGATGCINTAGSAPTTIITVNTTPTVGIASVSNGTICSGNNTVITPNGASTYTLMPGNMVGTSFNVSPSATTTYTINGTGATGCINTAASAPTTMITVNTTPTVGIASVSNGTICSGNNTVITPNGASTYTLMPGNVAGTSFNVSPSVTTTYTINGTGATGCISTAGSAGHVTITVNSLPSLAVSTLSNVSCFGMANGSVTLTPLGGAGSGYSITPASYTNLGPGVYTYTVADANLCTSSSSLSITQPTAALSALAIETASNTSCTSVNGSASVSVSGGTPSYTVNWSNGSTGASITNLNTGIHSYTVTDANNCSLNTGTVSMSGVTGINTTASMQTTVNCFGAQTGALTYTTSGGTTYSYTLIPVASPSASITNTSGQFTGLAAGSYSLISIDLMSGCTDMILNTIAQPINSLTVSAITTASVLCYNGTASVTANIAGGTPSYNYVWESNTSTGNIATYTAGTYTLQVSDANGCTTSAVSFTVNQPLSALSAITGSSANTSCTSPNGSFTVTANGGTPSYSFAVNGAMPVTTNVFSGLSTGSQTLTVMDVNNCTYSLSVTISGIPAPSVTLASFTNVTCFGDSNGSASLTVNGGTAPYTYNWSNGSLANVLSNVPVGVYTATVTDNGNCLAVTSVTITGPTALNTGIADILGACADKTNGHGSVTVSGGTPNYSISWSNGVNGNEIKNVLPGVYTATVTDAANCVSIIAVTVPVLPPSDSQCDELFIPQIITPNGDGINDAFVISKIETYPNNTLSIFNRWGSLIYSKKGYKNEWNGTANVGDATGNNLLPSGTYFIILDFGDDLSKPYHGYVELKY